MKVLVAYYSLTGHTEKLAVGIAAELSADIERIEEVGNRSGFLSKVAAAFQAATGRSARIHETRINPAGYDLVILGTPVWAWTMSTPMRSYIKRYAANIGPVAFFCTEGGQGGARCFSHMAELLGKEPVATLEVTETDLKSGAESTKLDAFFKSIAAHH